MASKVPQVQVVGLRALNRDIAKMSEDTGALTKAMSAAGARAVEPLAEAVRSALPRASGVLAGDVRVSGSKSGAAVRMGRASIRYAGWVEFGGHRMNPHDSFRDYQPLGRYLFPRARDLAPTAAEDYAAAISTVFANYPWTNDASAAPEAVHD